MSKRNDVVIDIGYALDFKGLAREITEELSNVKDKSVELGIDKEARKEIDAIKKDIIGLSNTVEKALSPGKVGKSGLSSLIDDIEKRTGKIEDAISGLKTQMENLSMGTMERQVSSIESKIVNLNSRISDTAKTINDISGSSSNVTLVNAKQQRELEKQNQSIERLLNDLKSLKNIDIDDIGDLSFNKTVDSFQDMAKEVDKLKSKASGLVKALKEPFSAGTLDSDATKNVRELAMTYNDIFGAINDVYRLSEKESGTAPGFNETLERMDKIADTSLKNARTLYNKISTISSQIQGELSDITTVSTGGGRIAQNGIVVPIKIGVKGKDLFKEAATVIDEVNADLVKKPLEVSFVLTSKWKSRRRREIMQQIEDSLGNLKDQGIKQKLSALIEDAEKQFSDDIKLNFSANFGQTQEQVEKFITNIEAAIRKAKISLYPNIFISDEAKENLRKEYAKLVAENPIKILGEAGDKLEKTEVKKIDKSQNKSLERFFELMSKINNEIDKHDEKFAEWANSFNGVIAKQTETLRLFSEYIDGLFKSIDAAQKASGKIKPITISVDEEQRKILEGLFGNIFSIQIEKADCDQIKNQLATLVEEVQKLFDTGQIKTWSTEYIRSLQEVANAMKGLLGKNPLSEMFEKWNESDFFMSTKGYGKGHIRERSALLSKDYKIVGDYDYGQTSSTANGVRRLGKGSYGDYIAGIHSHPNQYLVSPSGVNVSKSGKSISGDIQSWALEYVKSGVGKQLINTLGQIGMYDVQALVEGNKKLFSDPGLYKEFQRNLLDEVNKVGNGDKSAATEYIKNLNADDSLTKVLEKSLGADLKEFYTKLYSAMMPDANSKDIKKIAEQAYKNNAINFLDKTDPQKLNTSLEALRENTISKKFKTKSLQFDEKEIKTKLFEMMGLSSGKAREHFDRIFSGSTRNSALMKTAYRRASASMSGKGVSEISDIMSYMQKFTHSEFASKNPMGFPTGTLEELSKIGKDSGIQNLTENLQKLHEAVEKFSNTKTFDIGIKSEDIEKISGSISEFSEAISKIRDGGKITAEFDNESIEKASKSLEKIFNKLKSILTSLNTFSKLFQTAFDVLPTNELDKEFENIKTRIKEFSGDTKNWNFTLNKTKDAFAEIVSAYQKYQKQGGKKDFSELFSDKDLSKKMIGQYQNYLKNTQVEKNINEASKAGSTFDTSTVEYLKELRTVMSQLGDNSLIEKINSLVSVFENLERAISSIDFSNIKGVENLNSIIENADKLSGLFKEAAATSGPASAINKNIAKQNAQEFLASNMGQVNGQVDKFLEEQGLTQLNRTIDVTNAGLIRAKTIVRELNGEWKEMTLLSSDGVNFNIDKVVSEAAKAQKFEKVFETLKKLAIEAEEEQADILPLIKADDEAWQKMIDSVAEYRELLGDIVSVHRSLEQNRRTGEINESFRINGTTGSSVTVGNAGVVAAGQDAIGGAQIIQEAAKFQANFDKITANKMGFSYIKEYTDMVENLQSMINEYRALGESKKELIDPADIERANMLKESIRELSSALKNASGNADFRDGYEEAQKLLDKVNKTMTQKSGMPKELMNEYKVLAQTLSNIELGTPLSEVQKLSSEVTILNRKLAESGTIGRSMMDKIKISLRSQISQQIAMWFSVYDFIRYGRKFIETVHEMDDALTEMRKVSDENIQTLRAYQSETFKTASAIGTTGLQIQKSTADWLRLGESFEQAKESAKDATILYNVSEFESIDAATESLVSMSQAYKDLDKMEIIDVMNNVGNNFSISTDHLSMALQNAAAVLQTQGNDLYKSTALITAGNAITQDYSKTAGGVRTIALRLAG